MGRCPEDTRVVHAYLPCKASQLRQVLFYGGVLSCVIDCAFFLCMLSFFFLFVFLSFVKQVIYIYWVKTPDSIELLGENFIFTVKPFKTSIYYAYYN